jgi:hypothetical protein
MTKVFLIMDKRSSPKKHPSSRGKHPTDDKCLATHHNSRMPNLKASISTYLLTKDDWIYAAIALAFALLEVKTHLWSDYLSAVGFYTFALSPVLLFSFFKPAIKQQWPKNRVKLLGLVSMIVYPLLMMLIQIIVSAKNPLFDVFVVVLGIQLALLLSERFKSSRLVSFSMGKISLDALLLFFMLLVSVYAALLICSDLPAWYKANQINLSIRLDRVWDNLGLLFSITAQFFSLFFCGFTLFWINRHILVEKVWVERGVVVYALSVLATVALLYPLLSGLFLLMPINYMGEPIIPAVEANPFDSNNGQVALAVMLMSLPVIFTLRWHQKNNQLDKLAKEKTASELNLLKQQINPHFLFNTLNNLYALSRKKSDQAPEVILQLADLMRYVVYKGRENRVLASEEAKYIEDYISLQSIRLRKSLTLDVDIQIEDSTAQIEPLLLVILVENAFKHGIEKATTDCYLEVKLKVSASKLTFFCENSLESDDHSSGTPGIGLDNLKQRLALQYPERHQLSIEQSADSYRATLKIDLQPSRNQ